MTLCGQNFLSPPGEGHERVSSSFQQPWNAPLLPRFTPAPYLQHLLLAHFPHWPGSITHHPWRIRQLCHNRTYRAPETIVGSLWPKGSREQHPSELGVSKAHM